jgi:hypothetical protein
MRGPESFREIPQLHGDEELDQIELTWLRWEEAQADTSGLPDSAGEFHDWFKEVAENHTQPDFCRYLAEDATLDEIALFFLAEELVDSKFDDLMALVQLGATGKTKMTIAENYWDEMGEGDLAKVHTTMFEHSAKYMRKHIREQNVSTTALDRPEITENATLLLLYALNRQLVPRALGAMGVLEQSASPRFDAMVAGCSRLAVPEDVIEYQRIHVHVDADHGAEWVKGVFLPMVQHSRDLMREISIGILTRIRVADAYYAAMWSEMKAVRDSR